MSSTILTSTVPAPNPALLPCPPVVYPQAKLLGDEQNDGGRVRRLGGQHKGGEGGEARHGPHLRGAAGTQERTQGNKGWVPCNTAAKRPVPGSTAQPTRGGVQGSTACTPDRRRGAAAAAPNVHSSTGPTPSPAAPTHHEGEQPLEHVAPRLVTALVKVDGAVAPGYLQGRVGGGGWGGGSGGGRTQVGGGCKTWWCWRAECGSHCPLPIRCDQPSASMSQDGNTNPSRISNGHL